MTSLNLQDVDLHRCKEALTTNIHKRASGKTTARLINLLERNRLANVGKTYIFVCENENMVQACLLTFEFWILMTSHFTRTTKRIITNFPIQARPGIIGHIKDWLFPIKRETKIEFRFVAPDLHWHNYKGRRIDGVFFDLTPMTADDNSLTIDDLKKQACEYYE